MGLGESVCCLKVCTMLRNAKFRYLLFLAMSHNMFALLVMRDCALTFKHGKSFNLCTSLSLESDLS